MRTLVFAPYLPANSHQFMVEIWADGSVTLAERYGEGSWGPKHSPSIDDDGDHIRTDEHRVIGPPTISDDDYAAYLGELNL